MRLSPEEYDDVYTAEFEQLLEDQEYEREERERTGWDDDDSPDEDDWGDETL